MKNSKQSRSMETINPSPNVDQDTRLSGVYIRNLVKQLTTSSSSSSSSSTSSSPPTPPKNRQAPHKKQVRRRLHTTRPYQERLLNMAEARKEIVTALKYHRATMKQQQQQLLQLGPPSPPPPPALVLPSQTLGLSLGSFQELTNLDAACLYTNNNNNNNNNSNKKVVDDQKGVGSEGSRALGDREMEEIKSIGEMHEMEWNDTMNSATSAWWFKFLHNMEFQEDSETAKCGVDDDDQNVVELPLLWEGGNDQIYSTHANFELPSLKIEDMDDEWLC